MFSRIETLRQPHRQLPRESAQFRSNFFLTDFALDDSSERAPEVNQPNPDRKIRRRDFVNACNVPQLINKIQISPVPIRSPVSQPEVQNAEAIARDVAEVKVSNQVLGESDRLQDEVGCLKQSPSRPVGPDDIGVGEQAGYSEQDFDEDRRQRILALHKQVCVRVCVCVCVLTAVVLITVYGREIGREGRSESAYVLTALSEQA